MGTTAAPTRIVVGIGNDNTDTEPVLRYGIAEARRLDAELVAVRTWGPLADPRPRDALAPGIEEELTGRAVERIDEAFTAVGGIPADVQVRRYVVEGPAGPALVATADRSSDVIVIGRSHHHLARRAVFGSVPDYVMDHAVCPVIVLAAARTPGRPARQHAHPVPSGNFS